MAKVTRTQTVNLQKIKNEGEVSFRTIEHPIQFEGCFSKRYDKMFSSTNGILALYCEVNNITDII